MCLLLLDSFSQFTKHILLYHSILYLYDTPLLAKLSDTCSCIISEYWKEDDLPGVHHQPGWAEWRAGFPQRPP